MKNHDKSNKFGISGHFFSPKIELNPIEPDVYFEQFEKLRFLKKNKDNFFFDSSRQCKQLQLEKPSGIEFDMPIHKRLAINLLLRVGQKGPPPGSDRVKLEM